MKVNGTIARDIAIYFLDATQERYTPSVVARTVIQAKSIMKSGYTEEEIKSVIDYIIDEGEVDMYSIGYVSHVINDVLKKIEEKKNKEIAKKQKKEMEDKMLDFNKNNEVVDVETRERNQRKAKRIGNESRKRKESYSDLFER